MKARLERLSGAYVPGPGTYDPKRLGASTEAYAGSSAFKSHTDRAKHSHSAAKVDTHDPGEYEIMEHNSVNTQSKATFHTSAKSGKAGFGGTGKRDLRLTNERTFNSKADFVDGQQPLSEQENTPAPSAYSPLQTENGREFDMWVQNGTEKMKSASFATKTKRPTMALPSAKNPGPSDYHVSHKAIEAELGDTISKVGRDRHYTADHIDGGGEDCTTEPHVGPGSYTAVLNKSGKSDSIEIKNSKVVNRSSRYKPAVEGKSDKLAFNYSGPARELPFESHHGVASKAEATPEPGHYEPKVTEKGRRLGPDAATLETHNASAKKGTAQFHVTSPGQDNTISTKEVPTGWATPGMMTDPGAYNPNHNREINHQAKTTFQVSSKAGKGSFGAMRKRDSRLSNQATYTPQAGFTGDVEDTPAPSAYSPLQTENGREFDMWVQNGTEKMKSASFATKTKRLSPVLPSAKNPGPSDYHVSFAAIEAELGDTISKVGRDSKYTADHIDGGGEDCTTEPHVGPGSYTPILNKSGESDTMEHKLDVACTTGFGTDASMTSNSFRTMFVQWLGLTVNAQ